MWDDIAAVGNLSRFATFASVLFAFLAGLAGIVVVIADNRKQTLNAEFMNTPPALDVSIRTGEDHQFYVVIEAKNLIPFEFQYIIVTQGNTVLSGVPLEWTKVYPKKGAMLFQHRENLALERVKGGYAELVFDYRSLFAVEIGHAGLSGRLLKKYQLSKDQTFWIPIE